MPSRKQRRRRAKDRRHEYEYVYVDEEGREVEVDADEARAPAAEAAKSNGRRPRPTAGGRTIQPPSWRRVLKRGLVFAPFMFLTVTFLASELSWQARIAQTLWLLLIFIPFSYLLDRMMYRRFLKQSGASPAPGAPRRR